MQVCARVYKCSSKFRIPVCPQWTTFRIPQVDHILHSHIFWLWVGCLQGSFLSFGPMKCERPWLFLMFGFPLRSVETLEGCGLGVRLRNGSHFVWLCL